MRAPWRCGRCEKPQTGDVEPVFVPIGKEAHAVLDKGGAWTTIGICPTCDRKENNHE